MQVKTLNQSGFLTTYPKSKSWNRLSSTHWVQTDFSFMLLIRPAKYKLSHSDTQNPLQSSTYGCLGLITGILLSQNKVHTRHNTG